MKKENFLKLIIILESSIEGKKQDYFMIVFIYYERLHHTSKYYTLKSLKLV